MLKLAKPSAPRSACLRRSGSARSTPRQGDDDRAPGERLGRPLRRKRQPQDQRQERHQERRAHERPPPADRRREEAARRAREQDSRQKAGHDRADGGAAFFAAHQPNGEGDRHLRQTGAESEHRARDHEHRIAGGERHEQGRDAGRQRGLDHQSAALATVAERHQEQHPQRIAELTGHQTQPDLARRDAERARHRRGERLRVIQIRDAEPGGHRQQDQRAPRRRLDGGSPGIGGQSLAAVHATTLRRIVSGGELARRARARSRAPSGMSGIHMARRDSISRVGLKEARERDSVSLPCRRCPPSRLR